LIFTEENPAVFFFYKAEEDNLPYVKAVRDAARESRDKIFFVESTSLDGI